MTLIVPHPADLAAPLRRPTPRFEIGGWLVKWRREWRVRRELAAMSGLGGEALRDMGLAPGGVESAVRHGREAA